MRSVPAGFLALTMLVLAADSVFAQTSGATHTDPAISRVSSAYEAANNAEDLAKLIALYTDDAVEMPPNAPAIRGRSAIESFYKGLFAEMDGKATLTPIESAISGPIGYEIGTFSQTMKTKNGQTTDDVGKYMVLLKQGADKQWQVAYVIYNSDKPPMQMPPSSAGKKP